MNRSRRGFSIVELMVVVSIIIILTGIVLYSITEARKSSRDKRRATDLAQLELVMRLYAEKNFATSGGEIDCATGIKIDGNLTPQALPSSGSCNEGDAILAFIRDQLGTVPADPLGPNNRDYYYYFDKHNCNNLSSAPAHLSDQHLLLFAANTERRESNLAEECPYFDVSSASNDGGFQRTTDYGGSFSPSSPYIHRIDFSE
jgi:type II secretory pathway pseudopilin PulG